MTHSSFILTCTVWKWGL